MGSIVKHFADEFEAHATLKMPPCEPELIAELVDVNGGVALLDERHRPEAVGLELQRPRLGHGAGGEVPRRRPAVAGRRGLRAGRLLAATA